MNKKITDSPTMADQITSLPTLENQALQEIIRGMYQGKPLLGPGGLLTSLVKDLTQIALQGEMEAHLQGSSLEEGNNRRNGSSSKTMKTSSASFELEVPRDRNGSFEPVLVKKRQTVFNEELDNKILALYGLGTSYDGISSHLQDIYGVEVSAAMISAVTDKLVPMLSEWRSRPLESVYAVVFLDAMFFKVKQDNKVTTKVIYNVMGISGSGGDEGCVERVLGRAGDGDLGEEGEGDGVFGGAEGGDLGVGAGLLAGEVVGREAEDDEAAVLVLLIEGFEGGVLRGEAALGGDVDEQKDAAGVVGE